MKKSEVEKMQIEIMNKGRRMIARFGWSFTSLRPGLGMM